MAMKELVERDCGGANPLMKLAQHYSQDKSLTESGIRRAPFHAGVPVAQATEEDLVNEYLRGNVSNEMPTTFRMDSLLQEMRQIDQPRLVPVPQRAPSVAAMASTDERWAEEYLDGKHAARPAPSLARQWTSEFEGWAPPPPKPFAAAVMPESSWAADYLDQNTQQSDQKWPEQFLEDVTGVQERNAASELVEGVKDPKLANTEPPRELSDQWAQEFSSELSGEAADDADFWASLQRQWDHLAKEEADTHPWMSEYDAYQTQDFYKDYRFTEDNPHMSHSNALEEGKRRLEAGDIANAVLLFEAAVQHDETMAEAWQLLGTTQAANEQEAAAIAALRKCLTLQPSNLTALMALAVSYTNESMQSHACETLRSWLRENPAYSKLVPPPEAAAAHSPFMSHALQEEVKSYFLRAVQETQAQSIDAELQVILVTRLTYFTLTQTGLGVLFNLSGDYDKAADCFSAALQVKPQDSLLWNKLGATLANGSRSEEAVKAYGRALELAPGYIRTRYNLGIACVNLSAYSAAVEHFLAALNLQRSARGPAGARTVMSDNIWSTLRMAISLMGRTDLHLVCDERNLDKLNHEFPVS